MAGCWWLAGGELSRFRSMVYMQWLVGDGDGERVVVRQAGDRVGGHVGSLACSVFRDFERSKF